MGIDARKKPDVCYVINVAVDVVEKMNYKLKKFPSITPDHEGLMYNKNNLGGLFQYSSFFAKK